MRLIAAARGEAVSSFLDLGYGGGILAAPSCAAGPRRAAFSSISPRPCSSQRGMSSPYGEQVTFAVAGYGDSGYEDEVRTKSGRSQDEVIETEVPHVLPAWRFLLSPLESGRHLAGK